MREIFIEEGTGIALTVKKGELLKIVDVEGQQVADLFAVNLNNHSEFFSAAVTIDCKESLKITKGDTLFSNLYNAMLNIVDDTVSTNDMLFPCCRSETYEFFYNNGSGHKNCFDNINNSLSSLGVNPFKELRPFNIFMNTNINLSGELQINPPISKSGDHVTLQVEMDLIICVSACPLVEGSCNAGRSKPIRVIVENP